jgi:hypothetical protein
MGVRVHETGQHRDLAEIELALAPRGRRVTGRMDRRDPPVVDVDAAAANGRR